MMEQGQEVVKEAPGLIAYATSVGVLGGLVWGFSEGLGRTLKVTFPESLGGVKWLKFVLAVSFGLLFGLAGKGVGWLPTPSLGGWSWLMAALMGLAGTFTAKGVNDVVVAPLTKKRSRLP